MKKTMNLMAVTLSLGILASGCVSKQRYEQAETELGNCEDEKAQLEASNIAWEQRFDRESSRWEELEASIADSLPQALTEFHDERDRILRLVPEQVESEVDAYLEDYFSTVMKGFQFLKKDNDEIKMQLQATQRALASVSSDTQSISTAVDQTLAAERLRRDIEIAHRQDVSQQLSALISEITSFDQERINCKSCEDRVKLNRKEREAILGFHAELLRQLSALQSFARAGHSIPASPAIEEDLGDTEEEDNLG